MDFLTELAKLIKYTPKHALPSQNNVNCPYNSFLYKSKDCYLCYSSSFLESCFYLDTALSCKDCVDGDYINQSELCYECLDCNNCYNCDFCRDCRTCNDLQYCYECQGCKNCFGCVGLHKKEHHIFNKRYSREDYTERLKEIRMVPVAEIHGKTEFLRRNFPHPSMHLTNCENCFGDYIKNSKNCYMGFSIEKCEDCMYVYDEVVGLKDCVDCTHMQNNQLCYNLMSAADCYNVDSSWWAVNCRDSKYCFCIQGCSDCFGCVYLQRKQYHILNKPYKKEEYFKLVMELEGDLKKRKLHGKYLVTDAVELARNLPVLR